MPWFWTQLPTLRGILLWMQLISIALLWIGYRGAEKSRFHDTGILHNPVHDLRCPCEALEVSCQVEEAFPRFAHQDLHPTTPSESIDSDHTSEPTDQNHLSQNTSHVELRQDVQLELQQELQLKLQRLTFLELQEEQHEQL